LPHFKVAYKDVCPSQRLYSQEVLANRWLVNSPSVPASQRTLKDNIKVQSTHFKQEYSGTLATQI